MISEEQKYRAETSKIAGFALMAPFIRITLDPYLFRDFELWVLLLYKDLRRIASSSMVPKWACAFRRERSEWVTMPGKLCVSPIYILVALILFLAGAVSVLKDMIYWRHDRRIKSYFGYDFCIYCNNVNVWVYVL